MESAKTLNALDEFAKTKPKDIPRELDEYLRYVATTGDPVYQWSLVKILFRQKLLNVIMEFYGSSAVIDIPLSPNLDVFNFENIKKRLLERYDTFSGVPFTIQRIAELLTAPKKQYSRLDKYMRALEKNIWVVSTREAAFRELTEQAILLNGVLTGTSNNIESSEMLKRQNNTYGIGEDDEELVELEVNHPNPEVSYDNVCERIDVPEVQPETEPLQPDSTTALLVVPANKEPTQVADSLADVTNDTILVQSVVGEEGHVSECEPTVEERVEDLEDSGKRRSNCPVLEAVDQPEAQDNKADDIVVTEVEDETDSSSKVTEVEELKTTPDINEPPSDDTSDEATNTELIQTKSDLKRKIEEVIGEDEEVPKKKLETTPVVPDCVEREQEENTPKEICSVVELVENIVETVENITEELEIAEFHSLTEGEEKEGEMESAPVEEKLAMVVEEAEVPMDVDETSVMSVKSVTSPMTIAVDEGAEPMESSQPAGGAS